MRQEFFDLIEGDVGALQQVVEAAHVSLGDTDADAVQKIRDDPCARSFWRVPDEFADSPQTFVKLMHHGRGIKAYAVLEHGTMVAAAIPPFELLLDRE